MFILYGTRHVSIFINCISAHTNTDAKASECINVILSKRKATRRRNKMQSETADFATGTTTWRTGRNMSRLLLWLIRSIMWNMLPFTKPEVHNILHCQRSISFSFFSVLVSVLHTRCTLTVTCPLLFCTHDIRKHYTISHVNLNHSQFQTKKNNQLPVYSFRYGYRLHELVTSILQCLQYRKKHGVMKLKHFDSRKAVLLNGNFVTFVNFTVS